MSPAPLNILQIGHGAFGRTHVDAWRNVAGARSITVADPDAAARAALAGHAPWLHAIADWRPALAGCDAVSIVTPTDTHHAIAAAAIAAGKPVLIEKPVTASLGEALDLAARARKAGVVVRGGYYFRHHPKTATLRALIDAGRLGTLRILQGRFAGYKRTREDAGALLNDAVHFIDLFVWLLDGRLPDSVYAVTRDHFGRGLEDFALLTLTYRNGPVVHIEAGCVQPGRWPDAVVPDALTSKEIAVSGRLGGVAIDYAGEAFRFDAVEHVRDGKIWRPRFATGAEAPVSAPAAGPVEVVAAELRAFLEAIAAREIDRFDGIDGSVAVARIVDAAQISAPRDQPVTLSS